MDFKPVEKQFYEVSVAMRTHLMFDTPAKTQHWPAFLKCAERFMPLLQKMTENERCAFVDRHETEFKRLRFALLTRKHDKRAMSLHDHMFSHLCAGMIPAASNRSQQFDAFVEGITYFQGERADDSEVPVYHRRFSCGPVDPTNHFRFANTMCSPDGSRKETSRRKHITTVCYLERLIFEQLFQMEEPNYQPVPGDATTQQDAGHKYRLELSRNDFETCFPKDTLRVHIRQDLHGVPTILDIYRYRRGELLYHETYIKEHVFTTRALGAYARNVECVRRFQNEVFFKVQDFSKERKWKRVGSALELASNHSIAAGNQSPYHTYADISSPLSSAVEARGRVP